MIIMVEANAMEYGLRKQQYQSSSSTCAFFQTGISLVRQIATAASCWATKANSERISRWEILLVRRRMNETKQRTQHSAEPARSSFHEQMIYKNAHKIFWAQSSSFLPLCVIYVSQLIYSNQTSFVLFIRFHRFVLGFKIVHCEGFAK